MSGRRLTRQSNEAEKRRQSLYESDSDTDVSEGSPPKEEDLSFRDTEPLDVSLLDTEPLSLEEESDKEEGGGEDEEEEKEESVVSSSTVRSRSPSESEQENNNDTFSPLTPSELNLDFETDDTESRFHTPSPLDMTTASSEDVKRVYTELINSIRECNDGRTPREQADEILMDSIQAGEAMMRQMEASITQSSASDSATPHAPKMRGGAAMELLLACEHTKLCATYVKDRALELGQEEADFRMDQFVATLKRQHVDRKNNYSVISLVANLVTVFGDGINGVDHLKMLFGAVTFKPAEEATLTGNETGSQKEKKPRTPRKRDTTKGPATQSEILNDGEEKEEDEEGPKEGAEALAKEILKGVKTNYQESGGKPQNLMEVAAQGDTVSDVVSRLFGVSFVVRDGRAALGTGGEQEEGVGGVTKGVANLTLTPAKPTETKGRQQHIASFSAKFIKEMLRNGGTFPNFGGTATADSDSSEEEGEEE